MKKKNRFVYLFVSIIVAFVGIFSISLTKLNAEESDGLAKVIYVAGSSGSDSNNGLSSDSAVSTMKHAYELVTNDGDGIIVVSGNMEITPTILPAKAVTITSKIAEEDYTGSAVLSLYGHGYAFQANTLIENISLSTSNVGYGFTANGYDLHIGKGVTVTGGANDDFYLIGGRSIIFPEASYIEGANITVESGSLWTIYGAGYTNFGNVDDYLENTGDINISVTGDASIGCLFAGFKAGNDYTGENPDKFGNVNINVNGNSYVDQIYLGSECYRNGYSVQYEDTTITLDISKSATVASLYGGGQYIYHQDGSIRHGQYQSLENVVINYYGATVDDALYLGGIDGVYSYDDLSTVGPTEVIKNLVVNLYADLKGTIVPAIKADVGIGVHDDAGSFTIEKATINLINNTTFEYFDFSNVDNATAYPPVIRVIGYVNSGSLATPEEHVEDYNPQYIEFKSFDEEKNLEKIDTNVYTRDEDIEYMGVSVDETTSTIIYVGGEDTKDSNGVSIIPVITATKLFESQGGVLSFKFVKSDNSTLWQPTVDTVVFQVPVCDGQEAQNAMVANFAMQNMDGYRLAYREGTYNDETIGQIIIVRDLVKYEVEHYKENVNGTFTLAETDDDLVGSIGSTVTATAKTYENYSLDTELSTQSGTVFEGETEDDYLVLKLYYKLNTVTVSTTDSITGAVTNNTYKVTETVTMEAEEKYGYDFKGWYNNGELVSEDSTYEFEASDDINLFEKYEAKIFTVTATFDVGTGDITKVTTYVPYLNKAIVVATEEYGYHFIGWYKGEKQVYDELTYEFVVTESVLLVAKYEKNDYTVTLIIDDACGAATQTNENGEYKYLDKCSITVAKEEYGYTFAGWYDEENQLVTKDLVYNFVVLNDVTLKAKFDKVEYTVSTIGDKNAGTVTAEKTYLYLEEATVVATVNKGYNFTGWYIADELVTEDLSYSFDVTKDVTLVAKYEKIIYTVKTICDAKCGTATKETKYSYLDEATVNVVVNTGYNFTGWYTEDDTLITTELEYSFSVVENVTLVAKFDKNIFLVTAITNLGEGQTSKVTTYVYYLNYAFVVAEEYYGYGFTGWYDEEGTLVSEDLTYKFQVTRPITLTASFEKNEYTVTSNYNEVYGSIEQTEETGVYKYLDKVTLKPVNNDGYHFVGWYDEDGELITSEKTYIFTIKEDVTIEARFAKNEYTIKTSYNSLMGSVVGDGTYEYLDEATLEATLNLGYNFTGWYIDGALVESELTYVHTVTENALVEARFAKNRYQVIATCNLAMGTVTGSNTYEYLDEATLKASANTGYHFTGWYSNEEQISESTSYTYQVTDNLEVIAKFEKNTYTVTVTFDETKGNASGIGTYEYLDDITLEASALEGYHFIGWYSGEDELSVELTYAYSVTANLNVEARFVKNRYQVTATCNLAMGTVTGSNTYEYLDEATLVAKANTGYHFTGWYNGEIKLSSELTYTYSVVANLNLEAKFAKNEYTVTVNFNEVMGSVVGAGTYEYLTKINLAAIANEGYHFVGWYLNDEEVSTDLTYVYQVTANLSLEVKYAKNEYTVNASCDLVMGSVSGADTYEYLDEAVLVAKANYGYHFTGWYNGEIKLSSELTYTYSVVASLSLEAKFAKNEYSVTANYDDVMGNISGTGTYEYLENITLEANVNEGYRFIGWYVDGTKVSSETTYSYQVTANFEVEVKFVKMEYKVKTTYIEAMGSVVGAGTYEYLEEVTLEATVNTGYNFTGWYANGALVETKLTYTLEVTENTTIEARFAKNTYTVTTTFNEVMGTASGAGTYEYLTVLSLNAKANEGYHFVGWYTEDTEVSTDLIYTYNVIDNLYIEARFAKNTYIVSTTFDLEKGNVVGAGTYEYLIPMSLNAQGNEGYHFVGWYIDGALVSTEETYSYQVKANLNVEAKFAKNQYSVTANFEDVMGNVVGAGTYEYLDEANLTANANEGYHFVGWYINETLVATDADYACEVKENVELVAKFEKNEYTVTVNFDEAMGSATGAGTYEFLTTVTLTAEASEGHSFKGWYIDDALVSTELAYELTVKENLSIEAKFENVVQAEVDKAKEEIENQAQEKIDEINNDETLTEEEKQDLIDKIEDIKNDALDKLDSAENLDDVNDLNGESLDKIEDLQKNDQARKDAINRINEDADAIIDEINNMTDLTDEEKQEYIDEVNKAKADAIEKINAADNADGYNDEADFHEAAQGKILDRAATKHTENRNMFLVITVALAAATVSMLFFASRFRRRSM